MDWFSVDKEGLAKILERKGKEFVLFELISNAWDEDTSIVDVVFEKPKGSRLAYLTVSDDSPDGFRDLSHSFTLFAESVKKGRATQRGRFNLGEKLVLALCEEAEIVSTTGSIAFTSNGRRRGRKRTQQGTVFKAAVRMTNEEFLACLAAAQRLIPPERIVTRFNGRELLRPRPIANFRVPLKTEVADAEGALRPTVRKTDVHVFKPQDGQKAMLYEMGVPVVETGDSYHLDVQQKVPVNIDRDNVAPSYLRTLRTMTLNALHGQVSEDDVNLPWVRDALGDENVSEDAVRTVVRQRFGERSVVYDPSDREANSLAAARGYTVVAGNQLSKLEWENVRRSGVLLPAGKVTPSPKPFSEDGQPLKIVKPDAWSVRETVAVQRAKAIAFELLGAEVSIKMADDPGWRFQACYGQRELIVNRAKAPWFFKDPCSEESLDLLIHELGHEYEENHLSASYYRALSSLGARLAVATARNPRLIRE